MAPSHSLAHNLPSQPTNSPDLDLQMPNVFVVPPEEDQAPPWCCFDATQVQYPQPPAHILSTKPDAGSLESRLNLLLTERVIAEGSPIFQRPTTQEQVVMPKKLDGRGTQQNSDLDTGNAGNDSDVIEVVKVSRSSKDKDLPPTELGGPSSGPTIKRSKTFRLKAAKALSSIRSLGKGTSSKYSRPSAKDTFAPSAGYAQPPRAASFSSLRQSRDTDEEVANVPPQAAIPNRATTSRRGSVVLSQLFSPKVHSPSDATVPSSDSTTSTSCSVARSSTASTINSDRPASPSLQLHRCHEQHPFDQDIEMDSDAIPKTENDADRLTAAESRHVRPTSPSLTINTLSDAKSKRRFSMMSLRQIFTFSSSTSQHSSTHSNLSERTSDFEIRSNIASAAERRDVDAASLSESELGIQLDTPSLSRTPAISTASSGSESSSGVETPTEEVTFLPSVGGHGTKRPSLDWRIPALDSMGVGISNSLADSLGDGMTDTSPMYNNVAATKAHTQRSDADGGRDLSFEMRLDSLHFDSLSFDPENFDVSKLLN